MRLISPIFSILRFERAATEPLTVEARDDEDAGRRRQFISVRRDARGRVKSGFEAGGQLAEILRKTPTRITAVSRIRLDFDCGRLDQSLDLRHQPTWPINQWCLS
jgi:hypothetical protein